MRVIQTEPASATDVIARTFLRLRLAFSNQRRLCAAVRRLVLGSSPKAIACVAHAVAAVEIH
jgi:hypothetical protein